MAHPFRHWLLLVGLVVLWGSAFLALKYATAGMPPAAVAFHRLWIGAVVIAPFTLLGGARVPKDRMAWIYICAMSLVGNALPFFLIAWGQARLTSSTTGVLMAVVPLAIVVLAHFTLPDERLTRRKAAGFLIGFCGLIVLFGERDGAVGASDAPLRAFAVLAGAVCYAINAILSRKMPAMASSAAGLPVLVVAALMAAPAGVPAAAATIDSVPIRSLVAVAALGVFSTGLATLVYYEIVRVAGVSFLALTNYFVPIWAVLLGALLGGETIGWRLLAALGLVLLGVLVTERRAGRAMSAGPQEPDRAR